MNLKAFKKTVLNTVTLTAEYRFNYYMLILSTILTLIMEWAVFKHVFEGRTVVGGLPKSHAFSFVLFGMILRTTQLLWGKTAEMIDEVREGTYRRYLLQPISHPIYFVAQAIGGQATTFAAALVICLVYKFGFDAPESFLSLQGLPQTALSFLFSCIILWLIYLCIIYAAFFLEESQFMLWTLNISMGIFSGTILPLSWLPEWLKLVLQYTPMPILGDWPLRTALGLCSPEEFYRYLLLSCAWMIGLFFLMRLLHKKGLQRYEAFGG